MNTDIANIGAVAHESNDFDPRRVISYDEFTSNLWDSILDRYRAQYNEGELYKILKQAVLVRICDGTANLYSPRTLLEHEKAMLIQRTLLLMEHADFPVSIGSVNLLSAAQYQAVINQDRPMLSPRPRLKEKAKLSPSDITEMAALTMDIKEAEILGLLPSKIPGRAIVTFCFISFGYGDQNAFVQHMRYDSADQMWSDVLTIEAAQEVDPEIGRLVDLVMAEMADLLKANFSVGIEPEDDDSRPPLPENVIEFPNTRSRAKPFQALLRDV